MSHTEKSPEGRIRRLYLWRHAKAVHGDMADFERPLTERGRHDAELLAGWLTSQAIEPDEVLCSPSHRTTETWKALRRRLRRQPEVHFPDSLYGAAASELLDRIHSVDTSVGSLLLVGHNPGMEELAVELSGPDSDAGELAELQLKFPTGAVAILYAAVPAWSELEKGKARLVRVVRPRDLG